MKTNLRAPVLFLTVVLGFAAVGAAVWALAHGGPRWAAWQAAALPGSQERIAQFPELMKLSAIDARPVDRLAGLPFRLDAAPRPAVTPAIERQTLLGADSLVPRAPQAIVADYEGRANLSDEERRALVDALLDLGQVDRAIAVRQARVAQAPGDQTAHRELLDLLEAQNRAAAFGPAADAAFQALLQKGRDAKDAAERRRCAADAAAMLTRRAAVEHRALLPPADQAGARLALIDAFPDQPQLLVDYAGALTGEGKPGLAIAAIEPRLSRYAAGQENLWEALGQAYRKLGQNDRFLRVIEANLERPEGDSLLSIYANALREANLLETRRAELRAALQAAPTAANLGALLRLELGRDRADLAREALDGALNKASAEATVDELAKLAELASKAGANHQAAATALDAAALGGDAKPELWLRAARLTRAAGDQPAWPAQTSPGRAFQADFADRGPGVVGGLLSLGTNRMGARAAMHDMPAAGARYANDTLAVRLALDLAARADAQLAFEAGSLAVDVLAKAGRHQAVAQVADRLLARAGDAQPNAGRILLWYADAAAARKEVEAEIAALRRAASRARELGQDAAADQADVRLERLLIDKRRYPEALALKWERVERFQRDEAAIKELLKFAESHKLFEDEARAYRTAIERFDRKTWSDKFARWLLRQKRQAEFEQLVGDAAAKLGEGELAKFLTTHLKDADAERAGDLFFEKIHSMALQRFPANVTMNARLLDFYESRGFGGKGRDRASQDKFLDLALRCFALDAQFPNRLLPRLAQRGMLPGVMAKLEQAATLQPVEVYLWTRLQQFRADYEAARQGYAALAEHWGGQGAAAEAKATLARSLARSFFVRDPRLFDEAAATYGKLADRRPRDTAHRTLQGEALIEGGKARDAAAAWERIAGTAPGDAARWLELATLYWDYFAAPQALDTLAEARRRLDNPDLHATEMAYLLEDQGRRAEAIEELTKAALSAGDEGWSEAGDRLIYLVRAKKATATEVDDAFWRRLTRRSGRSAEGVAYLRWLRNRGEIEQAKDAARRLLPLYNDAALAEDAAGFFGQYGDERGVEACLDRLLQISGRDPAMLRRLAEHYEKRQNLAAADKLVEELAGFGRKDLAREDGWRYAADYYWRTERRPLALAYLKRLAEEASDRRGAAARWAAYADRCLEDRRADQALAALADARRARPLDAALVGATARAYAAKNDAAGLAAFYQGVLKELRAADVVDKKEREVELRGKLIDALTEVGRSRDAIEEHIQIINATAPDEAPALAAYRYAKRYNQLAPLQAYYERETQRANRDYRWQYVTALFYEAEGRYADAAKLLDRAAANEPQRLAILERRAQVLIKAGEFDGAVAVYRTLAARRLTGEDYQLRIAETLYLAGRPLEAETWLDRILAAPNIEIPRVADAARLAKRFGRQDAQRKYAAQALNLMLEQPDKRAAGDEVYAMWLDGMLETAGPAGAMAAIQEMLERLSRSAAQAHPAGRQRVLDTRRQVAALVGGELARWLGEREDEAQRQAAAPLFAQLLGEPASATNQRENSYEAAIAAARTAQLPDLADELLRKRTAELHRDIADTDAGRNAASGFVKRLRARGAVESFDRLAAQATALPAANGAAAGGPDLEIAIVARAAGDAAGERQALDRYAGRLKRDASFVAPDPALDRWYGLLSEVELDKLVNGDYARPGPLAVWLGQHGQTQRLVAALDNHYRKRTPSWLLAKKALAYSADPKFAPQARQAFNELLGWPLRIGETAGAKRPPTRVTEKTWTHYADRFGRWLLARNDPDAAVLLYAQPEQHPLSANAYLEVAAALDEAKRFPEAESFLDRGETLAADEATIAARARHLHAQGRDREAAAELAKMVAAPDVRLAKTQRYAELMREIGRGEEALVRWKQVFVERQPRLRSTDRHAAFVDLIRFARETAGERAASSLARELLADGGFNGADLRGLIESWAVPPPAIDWTWRLALERMERDSQATVWNKRSLAEAALARALTVKEKALARRALAALEQMGEGVWDEDSIRLQRLRAAIAFDGKRDAEALARKLVVGSLDESFVRSVVSELEDAEAPDAADRVWLAFFEPIRRDERLLGRFAAVYDEGEAEAPFPQKLHSLAAHLRLGNQAAAGDLATELEERAGQDVGELLAIARALTDNGQAAGAVRLADKAAAFAPLEARTHRARVLARLAAGRAEDAAGLLGRGWQAGVYGQSGLGDLLRDAAAKAADDATRWEKAVAALPSPVRELALAESHVQRGDGQAALAAMRALSPPLRYPTLTWRLRAQAARLAGDAAQERTAALELLRLRPQDKEAARRVARLELPKQPFAGLLRLSYAGMPLQPGRTTDPLATVGDRDDRLESWFGGLPRAEREDMAMAVMQAFVAVDWPAAAAGCGKAALTALGDDASRALRNRVEELAANLEKLRRAQPARFTPNENLVQ